MKKKIGIILGVILFSLSSCGDINDTYKKGKWDCSVVNESLEESAINYSEEKVATNSEKLCVQNRNEFSIHLYLYLDNEEKTLLVEREMKAGDVFTFDKVKKDEKYTLGVNADVVEGKEIHIMVYDADTDVEPYSK